MMHGVLPAFDTPCLEQVVDGDEQQRDDYVRLMSENLVNQRCALYVLISLQ